MIKIENNNHIFKKQLMTWYGNCNFNLPWRGSNDPYKIYLSEVMLQQTQVNTVIPYYTKWLKVFPTLQSVAEAEQEQILKQWEGMGYYSRARNFHRACQIICEEFGGTIPNTPEEFCKLPGVGPYISSAVLSIAYERSLPAVDANAIRVASRLKLIKQPYPKNYKPIYKFYEKVIPNDKPGDFNQAIMDLGREICTSNNPDCSICPIATYCQALVNNCVDKYPVRVKPAKKPHYNIAVGVIWKNGQILISKRRENGLLGGLWEFPGGKIETNEKPQECIVREVKEELGVSVKPTSFLKQIRHSYTHFSITMDAYNCEYLLGSPEALDCDNWQWIYPHQIGQLPFPKANHKLFDTIFSEANKC